MNNQWAVLLSRRIESELKDRGYTNIDVCNHRLMGVEPIRIYAVVVADCEIYSVSGYNENEVLSDLHNKVTSLSQADNKELIYLY